MKINFVCVLLIFYKIFEASIILNKDLYEEKYIYFLQEIKNLEKLKNLKKYTFIISDQKTDSISSKATSDISSNKNSLVEKNKTLKRSFRIYRKMSDEIMILQNKAKTICVINLNKYNIEVVNLKITNTFNELQHNVLSKKTIPIENIHKECVDLRKIENYSSAFIEDFLTHEVIPDCILCLCPKTEFNFNHKCLEYKSFFEYWTNVEINDNIENFKNKLENDIILKIKLLSDNYNIQNLHKFKLCNNETLEMDEPKLQNFTDITSYKTQNFINNPLQIFTAYNDFILAFYASKYMYNTKNVEMVLGGDTKYIFYIKDDLVFNKEWSCFKPEILTLFYEEDIENDKKKIIKFLDFFNMKNECTNKTNDSPFTNSEIFNFITLKEISEKNVSILNLINKSYYNLAAYICAVLNFYELKDISIILNGYSFENEDHRNAFEKILNELLKTLKCLNIKFNLIYEKNLSVIGAAYYHYCHSNK